MGTMWERLLKIEEHFLQLAGLLFQVSCLFYFGGVMLTAASKNSTYGEKNHFLCFPFSLLFICFTLRSLYSPPNRGFLNKQIILPPQSQFWRKCCSVCVCVQQRLCSNVCTTHLFFMFWGLLIGRSNSVAAPWCFFMLPSHYVLAVMMRAEQLQIFTTRWQQLSSKSIVNLHHSAGAKAADLEVRLKHHNDRY